jgi:cytochrome P450
VNPAATRTSTDVAMAWEERVHRCAHPVAYPFLTAVARRGPVVRVPGLGVVVSGAAEARRVLLDAERFTKTGPGSSADIWTPVLGPSVLVNMDGPAHGELRARLSGLFTPRAVGELTDAMLDRPLADLRGALGRGERVEVVRRVGEMAGSVICRMTGLPPTDEAVRSAFGQAREIVGMVRLHRRRLRPRQVARARAVLGGLSAPASAAFYAGDPSTVPGRMRDLGLNEEEALGAVGAFVLTGTETLLSFLPRLIALLADTGWAARLAAEPDESALATRVINEALRVTAPSPAMVRSVVAPGDVGGVPVRPGDRVIIATLLCCRGGAPFDPQAPQDTATRQLWFGAGAHFCIGMPLAMAQIKAVLSAVTDSVGAGRPLRVVDREPARRVLLPAYRRLEVVCS